MSPPASSPGRPIAETWWRWSGGAALYRRCGPALSRLASPLFGVLTEELDELSDLRELIASAIVDEPPFSLREGGLIREGYSDEVDRLRDIVSGGKGTLARIEAEEKEKTGIKTLRVGYNRVFGYYIEVSKGQTSLVPEHYIRKQTLTNGERYITPELKELESTILTAKDRITALEYELFTQVRLHLAEQAERIQRTAGPSPRRMCWRILPPLP